MKNLPANAGDSGLIPGVKKIPWRQAWQPTPVFLPGKSHGQRSLAGYNPWVCKSWRQPKQLSTHAPPYDSEFEFQFCFGEIQNNLNCGSQLFSSAFRGVQSEHCSLLQSRLLIGAPSMCVPHKGRCLKRGPHPVGRRSE